MMVPQIILSASLVLIAIFLSLIGKRFLQKDTILNSVLASIPLLLLIWIPLGVRNISLCILGGLFFFYAFSSTWGTLIGVSFILLANAYIPGGGTVVLLAIFLLFAAIEVYEALQHVLRLRRAPKMTPGKTPRREVEFGGIARSIGAATTLLPDISCSLWKIQIGETIKQSEAPIEILGKSGSALFDPKGATLALKDNQKSVSRKELNQMMDNLSFTGNERLTAYGADKDAKITLSWLKEGQEVYVLGLPLWESSPLGVGGYRDTPMLPVFRKPEQYQSTKEGKNLQQKAPYFADRSSEQVWRDSTYKLLSWSFWTLLCLSIATFQVLSSQ